MLEEELSEESLLSEESSDKLLEKKEENTDIEDNQEERSEGRNEIKEVITIDEDEEKINIGKLNDIVKIDIVGDKQE